MLFIILTACLFGGTHAMCYMRPRAQDSSANRTLGDGGYKILFSEPSNEYIPNTIHTIILQGSLSLEGLKRIKHFTLMMHSQDFPAVSFPYVGHFPRDYGSLVFFNSICTVSGTPDLSFERRVLWRAPSAGSGCVVFTAMILENTERWYAEDGALTKTICEAKTELVNMRKISKLEVAEDIEDESKRLHVKLIQKPDIVLPDDPIHLAKIKTVCTARTSSGPCAGYYRRWAFNLQTLKCEPFWYGGCQGNQNNFLSEKICYKACNIVRTALIRQALNVTVNRDRTTDSWSPSFSYSAGLGGVSDVKLDNV